jgi:hypothetical protein
VKLGLFAVRSGAGVRREWVWAVLPCPRAGALPISDFQFPIADLTATPSWGPDVAHTARAMSGPSGSLALRINKLLLTRLTNSAG